MATPFDATPASPDMDEIQPLHIDISGSDWRKMLVVPLRHDATFFDWDPSKGSTGAIYVWATAVPCGMGIQGFETAP